MLQIFATISICLWISACFHQSENNRKEANDGNSFELPDLEPRPKSKKPASKEIKEFTKISIPGLEAFDTKRDLSFILSAGSVFSYSDRTIYYIPSKKVFRYEETDYPPVERKFSPEKWKDFVSCLETHGTYDWLNSTSDWKSSLDLSRADDLGSSSWQLSVCEKGKCAFTNGDFPSPDGWDEIRLKALELVDWTLEADDLKERIKSNNIQLKCK